ncbi:hypothetical protein [Rubrimonas sp.]|uniref:hypothetical protein n=1 Tax=Rubrimonas sp. TaxID=2036015 RepID=UPI002FDD7A4D
MGAFRDPAKAAAALIALVPHAPRDVVARMAAMRLKGPLPRRGVLGPLERFFSGLAKAGRAPEQALMGDFAAAADNRAQLYALLWGLETWAPNVPLAAARPLRQIYDAALNAKYNAKPPKPRVYERVGPPPEEWPAELRRACALLERNVRIAGRKTLKPPKPGTRESIIQAVGMMVAARLWALSHGVELEETMPSPPALAVRDFHAATHAVFSGHRLDAVYERLNRSRAPHRPVPTQQGSPRRGSPADRAADEASRETALPASPRARAPRARPPHRRHA